MTPILPPDKLREIYLRADVSNNGTDNPIGEDEFIATLEQLATDALVAELTPILEEATYQSERADRKELHSNVDSVWGMLKTRVVQLTTVPDLSSEHETLRELDHE